MVKYGNSDHPSVVHPPHYLHELPQEDEERLENLFKSLDVDGNGKIDIHDLSVALREFGVNQSYAKKFIEHSDQNKSGDISIGEFIHYVKEHEKNLRLQFSHLDKNKDGMIDVEELIKAFKELGVEVDKKEATKLLQRMDQDGSLAISFDEWRDFLLYAPSTDIIEILKYWRHSTYLDIGEDLNVPDDFTPSEIASGQWWRHLLAGGIAGAVSRTCTAPLDRLKVYLQVHGTKQLGVKDCLKHLLQEGGIWSLWRGNGMNVVKIAPESAIKFMAYEQAKKIIRGNNTRELSIYERFVAGSLAGGISQTAIYPLEVMKTRLALRKTGEFSSIIDAAKKMYRKGGWQTFYRGYVPNLLGIIPYAGIDLAVYETIKNSYLRQHSEGEAPSVLLLLACGTVSSTCGQVCSYPLALVRTRLQAQVVTNVGQPQEMYGMMGVIRNIIQRDGPLGLYRGITPNFLKVAPAVSISYVVYERSRQTLGVNMT
ncbi:Calcium-binding mitochondrial carrier protein SCaMC-2 [Cryptotermes secundus]|uniref:Calcium-binding mitochondrial carrier protein SCaMC-2 n=1 Tax=Cryptotermes secundus TaxID=105785 RepID=A0A2J7RJI3_9NEOP|nr:calcium-binding mitochondrial carrier protein SCaMC-1-B isoform X2 [Cryptotermes secundus]PNF40992.1 Calcium-binding mitochondrial carrier protein SCaMC-2 [Cryptotermes secundus]